MKEGFYAKKEFWNDRFQKYKFLNIPEQKDILIGMQAGES
jgi:hypothetical protein